MYRDGTEPVIATDVADTVGRTLAAELHFDRLWSNSRLLRVVSKEHRVLYVGSLTKGTEKT
jgi:hypothetical protein